MKQSPDIVEVAPYWNVNAVYKVMKQSPDIVEVAPYWNVNLVIENCFVKNCG